MTTVRSFRRIKNFACLVAFALTAVGCASTRRTISVQTNPPGAMLKVNGEEVGQTPLSTTIKFNDRDERVLIEITKDSYVKITKKQHPDDPPALNYELEPEAVGTAN